MPILPVAIPLLVAAILLATTSVIPRRSMDLLVASTAAAVTAICGILTWQSFCHGMVVYWFGAWPPHHGVALGICFAIDPIGAGLAGLAALLVLAAVVFTWWYFDTVGALFHVLLLVFLAAMVGFCLTGDLFNLFVFFELMSAAAYALTGHKIEDPHSLEGALNFGIVNSLGAFMSLTGVGLLYGRTGALNLAQIGAALQKGPMDGLVIVAFTLVIAGLLVKAAIVPFHFWLADAHAVAPTPVCVLFSGVMVELGIYGVARVYWTIFSGPIGGHAVALRHILISMGMLTALLGSVMCFGQRHLKRLLAFSTISHTGMFLVGVGCLSPLGLAGSALYVLSHGMVKGALFLVTGIVLHRTGSVDEIDLQGHGKRLPIAACVFTIGGLGLAGMPPFGTYLGKSVLESAAEHAGHPETPYIFFVASVLTGGAVLRAAGRVFAGWGPRGESGSGGPAGREKQETGGGHENTPIFMVIPAVLLVLLPIGLGFGSHLQRAATLSAVQFVNRGAYLSAVLQGHAIPSLQALSPSPGAAEHRVAGLLWSLASAIGAATVALMALFPTKLPEKLRHSFTRGAQPTMRILRHFHSGHAGDYVVWLALGVVVIGAALAGMMLGT